ncbi:hypothetical protein CAPN004_23150 [Capnocytophaga cynodegmi]|nr:hypothetical protein CAPN004_23150 [Capnocytophaga cynodegmi]
MRLGGQFGFALDGNSRTIAHELGHGIFRLEHPFKKDETKKGTFRTLMDYAQETTFTYSDWKQINDPKLKIYAFQGQSQGEHNIYAHLGLTPDGTIFDKFYLKDSPISVIIKVSPEQYTINEIEYKGQAYRWNTQIAGFVNSGEVIIAKKIQKTIDKVNIYRSRKDGGCSYDYLTIAWSQQDKNATNIVERINSHIKRYSEKDWKIAPFTIRDDSCNKNFFAELLKRDSENCNYTEIEEGTNALRNLSQKDNIEANVIVMQINSFCVGAIRNLQYKEIEKLFDVVASQESIKEHAEVALLRLMTGIKTQDYSQFYTYLEANNNKIIKHLVKEIDDASIYFWTDEKNYTNFIGALVWMFNKSPVSLEKRWSSSSDAYATRVINLNAIEYESDISDWSNIKWSTRHNSGVYSAEKGTISLYEIFTHTRVNPYATRSSGISKSQQKEFIEEVSPLTPIIIVPEKGKIPLVEAALGDFDFGNGYYVVPAVFLKYNADKIRNDYIEKGIVTTLDVATIAISGGTALATKVHWVRRAWALAEITGAVGNIAINTQTLDPNSDIAKAVDAYNLVMAGVAVKNLSKEGYKLINKLSDSKTSLRLGQTADGKPILEVVGDVGKNIDDVRKIVYPSTKINGIPVVRISVGNNGKIAIIGRRMPYVRKVAEDLKKLGKEIEIFEPKSAFGGKGYDNLEEVYADFDKIKSKYPNGIIPYEKLKETLWYKENERWAKWIKEQGYDIYDIGDNPGQFINSFDRQNVPDASAFYDMEKLEIFNSK